MKRASRVLAVLSFLAACLACNKGEGDLGRKAANIVSDTAVLREANAAAGEIIRNSQDCDAVKAALPEANRKLDEATGKVRTPGGEQTLNALKVQVRTIAQNCP